MSLAPDPPRTPEAAEHLKQKLHIARGLVVASYAGLLLLFALTAVLRPEVNWALWMVQSLPLLIFVPGLWRGYYRTYSWLCFVVLLYFTWSVANVMSPLVYWRDILVVALTVILFVSAMMASRWRQQWFLWQSRQLD